MNVATPLEVRLRQLDLRFVPWAPEAHVTDERMALLAGGADPLEAEAAHLAACDACLDVLVALGEGLESLETLNISAGVASIGAPVDAAFESVPAARAAVGGAMTPTTWRHGNKRRLALLLGGVGFAFSAAAAVGVSVYLEHPSPRLTSAILLPCSPS